MAWNPLKKNQLTTKPSPAAGLISASDQQELDIAFTKLQSLEESTKKLYKEMKKYCDLVLNVHKLENRLSSDLGNSPICHHNSELRKIVEDYLSVLTQLEASVQELAKVSQRAVIEPAKKYGNYFNDLAQALHRRDQAVVEWQRLSAKVVKLLHGGTLGRPAVDVLKLESHKKLLNEATRDLLNIHNILMNEIPVFYDRRGEYFHPCLQSLARVQLHYYGEMTQLFTYVLRSSTSYISSSPVEDQWSKVSPSSSPRKSNAEFHENIKNKLSLIKALSIVK